MKVGIQNKEGRLILVWNDGTRRTMAISLPDTPRRNLLTTSEARITTRLPSIIEKAPPMKARALLDRTDCLQQRVRGASP